MEQFFTEHPYMLIVLLMAGLFLFTSASRYWDVLVYRAMWRIGPIALFACALIALGLFLDGKMH
jgi:hypothetical protein